MVLIKKSSTAVALLFFMTDSSDHISGKTGLSPTVTISKNGSSFASPSGTVSEIANGWYKVAGNATDTNTDGPIALHASASGADPFDGVVGCVVEFDPYDAVRAGLTALPNAAAEAAGGLFTRGTGAGQINQDANGRIDVSLKAILGTALTETAGQIAAGFKKVFDVASPVFTAASVNQTGDAFARLGAPAGASTSADIAALKTDLDGGVTVAANNDKTGYALTAAYDAAKTAAQAGDAMTLTSAYDAAKSAASSASILTTALSESYATLHSAPTLAQLLFEVRALQAEKSISSTTMTVKKIDGSTSAATYTLDDATNPTSITRAS